MAYPLDDLRELRRTGRLHALSLRRLQSNKFLLGKFCQHQLRAKRETFLYFSFFLFLFILISCSAARNIKRGGVFKFNSSWIYFLLTRLVAKGFIIFSHLYEISLRIVAPEGREEKKSFIWERWSHRSVWFNLCALWFLYIKLKESFITWQTFSIPILFSFYSWQKSNTKDKYNKKWGNAFPNFSFIAGKNRVHLFSDIHRRVCNEDYCLRIRGTSRSLSAKRMELVGFFNRRNRVSLLDE